MAEEKKVLDAVKKTTKKAKPSTKKSVNKGGRKADGTFAKGNKPKITSNYGRPIQQFSYRAMAKVRASKDPERVEKDLDALDKILDSEATSPMERMKALELKIKLNGGFDPVENKDVTPKEEPTNPFANLTEAELRKLAGEK